MEISWALPLGLGLAVCVLIGLGCLLSFICRIDNWKAKRRRDRQRSYYIIHDYVGARFLMREVEKLRRKAKKEEE